MSESTKLAGDRTPTLAFGRISLGGANIGNLFRAMTDEEALTLLQTAWDAGVRSFDTAPHYGLGLSERRMGAFLATKPRDEFILSTKAGRLLVGNPAGRDQLDLENGFEVPATTRRVWDFSADGIRRSLEESLERLGLDRVDILYLHDPDDFDLERGIADGVPAAAALRDAGIVRAIGIGSKSVPALLLGLQTKAIDLLMVAGRYTLLEQPAADAVIPAARADGVGIVNAGVFNSGLLARPVPQESAHYEYGKVPDDILDRARRLAGVCESHGIELPTAALQYPLREPVVRTVALGAASAEQFTQTAERMRTVIPDALWAELRELKLIP